MVAYLLSGSSAWQGCRERATVCRSWKESATHPVPPAAGAVPDWGVGSKWAEEEWRIALSSARISKTRRRCDEE
jgi:hypothetical protein